MSENQAAYAANLPVAYDRRRVGHGVLIDPVPTAAFRLSLILQALHYCWSVQPDRPRAVLDVAAGVGSVGENGIAQIQHHSYPAFVYHATEQSPRMVEEIEARVPNASVALWRWEIGGPSLQQTLEQAPQTFFNAYPVVLAAHVLEHVSDPFVFLDQLAEVTLPGGYLLICAARNDLHRTHFRKYDLNDLVATLSEYGDYRLPQLVWEVDYWMDLLVGVQRPFQE